MAMNRQKAWGWIGIAIAGAALAFVLRDASIRNIALAVGFFLFCGLLISGAFLLWEALGRLWRRFHPQPPLWQKPREFSALFEHELFDALHPRLECLEQDYRATLWKDRDTGQLWSAFAWDFEFTENVVYTPIRTRAEWRGMQAGTGGTHPPPD